MKYDPEGSLKEKTVPVDTAIAQQIVITDQLDTNLDLTTFEFNDSGSGIRDY